MRVHVYIDGFNLYRGGRELCGRGATGWKWLDMRALASSIAASQWSSSGPHSINRVVYCTARVLPTPMDPDLPKRQETLFNALKGSGSVDWIEYGLFIEKVKTRPLATAGTGRKRKPVLVTSSAPVFIKDSTDEPVRDAVFFVTVADREEKGSDINVATHLLVDALQSPPAMDAAIVISNDSDLKLAVAEARLRVPVGIVNPGRGYTAGALAHDSQKDVAGQWEMQLACGHFTSHQLPDPVGAYPKPASW